MLEHIRIREFQDKDISEDVGISVMRAMRFLLPAEECISGKSW